MLRIALSTLSARKGGMLGAFAAVCPGRHARGVLRHPARVQPAGADPRRAARRRRRRRAGRSDLRRQRQRPPVRAEAAAGQRRRAPAGGTGRPSSDRRPVVSAPGHRRARAPPAGTGRNGRCRPRLVQRRGSPLSCSRADARLARPRRSSSPPTSPRAASIHVGDRIRIATATTRASFTVAGIAATRPGHRLTREAPDLLPGRRRPTHLRHGQPSRSDRAPPDARRGRRRRRTTRRRRAEGQRSAGADRSAGEARRSPRRTSWDARTRSRA